MKRILLLLAAVLFFVSQGSSQCTPDLNNTHVGITPDSATNLPHAVVGTPYSTVMQIRVPLDTNVLYMGFPVTVDFDSVILTSFTGLPTNYTYACNPTSCVFPGNSNGCVLIQGPAPIASQAGMIYHLVAIVSSYGHVNATTIPVNQVDTVSYYFIQVDGTAGVSFISGNKFNVSQNTPNPFSKTSLIEFYSPAGAMVTVKVANMLGKIVMSKSVWATAGNNKYTFIAKEFEPGIYFYTISNDKQSVTKRMVVGYE